MWRRTKTQNLYTRYSFTFGTLDDHEDLVPRFQPVRHELGTAVPHVLLHVRHLMVVDSSYQYLKEQQRLGAAVQSLEHTHGRVQLRRPIA